MQKSTHLVLPFLVSGNSPHVENALDGFSCTVVLASSTSASVEKRHLLTSAFIGMIGGANASYRVVSWNKEVALCQSRQLKSMLSCSESTYRSLRSASTAPSRGVSRKLKTRDRCLKASCCSSTRSFQ